MNKNRNDTLYIYTEWTRRTLSTDVIFRIDIAVLNVCLREIRTFLKPGLSGRMVTLRIQLVITTIYSYFLRTFFVFPFFQSIYSSLKRPARVGFQYFHFGAIFQFHAFVHVRTSFPQTTSFNIENKNKFTIYLFHTLYFCLSLFVISIYSSVHLSQNSSILILKSLNQMLPKSSS